jgi:hypothetical protein
MSISMAMWTSKRSMIARCSLPALALVLTLSSCASDLGDDGEAADTTDTTAAAGDTTTSESVPEQLASADDTAPTDDGAFGDEAADIVGCTRIDDEYIEIELQNSLPVSATYWLTVGLYDDANTRLGDTSVFVNYVRAGERAIEQSYVFEDDGPGFSTCEVIDTDRFADEIDSDLLASVSACEVTGEDFAGDIEGSISVTNNGAAMSDFNVTVAFVDGDGVRRGTGSSSVEAVAPGETAPSEVYSTVPYSAGMLCDVVAVDSFES